MKKMTHLVLTAALAAIILATSLVRGDEPKSGDNGKALEALLKATKVDYIKVRDNSFKVAGDEKEGSVTYIVVQLKEIDLNGPKPYVFVWSIVKHLEADKVPEAILAKVAQFNENLKFGNISVSKDQNGGHTIYLNFSCFLKNLDAEQLLDFLKLNYGIRLVVRQELQRIIDEGPSEK